MGPSLAAQQAEETQRLIEQGKRGAGVTPDGHAQRVAANAQAESAARRARMAAPPAAASPAATGPTTAQRVAEGTRSVGQKAVDATKSLGQRARAVPGNLAKSALRGATPLTAAVSSVGVLSDKLSGRDQGDYYKRLGVNYDDPAPMLALPAAVERTGVNTIGVLGDVAQKAVNPIVQALGGSPLRFSDQQPATAAAAPSAAPPAIATGGAGGTGGIVPPTQRTGDPNEVIGIFQGRPVTRGESEMRAQNLNTVVGGGAAASPLRRPDIAQMGSGFAPVASRDSAINKYFDGLAKQIQDLHGGARFQARGSLATKLLELEKARASALGQNQGAMVDSQRNLVGDAGNRMSAETNLYGTDVGNQSALRRDGVLEANARVRASSEALKARQRASEAALKQITDEAGRLFPEDPKGQQAYIDSQNRRLQGLTDGSLNVGEVAEVTAQDRPFVALRDKANTLGNESDRDFIPTADGPSRMTFGEAVEGTFGDGAGGLGKYLRDQTIGRLPFTDTGSVLRSEDGRMLEWEELTPDERAAAVERQRSRKKTRGDE